MVLSYHYCLYHHMTIVSPVQCGATPGALAVTTKNLVLAWGKPEEVFGKWKLAEVYPSDLIWSGVLCFLLSSSLTILALFLVIPSTYWA